jgi:hypothetical protein
MTIPQLKYGLTALCFLVLVIGVNAVQNSGGPPNQRTGAPNEMTCATPNCHGGTVNAGPGNLTISVNTSDTVYQPGKTYTVEVTVAENGISRFGFELTALFASDDTRAGELQSTGQATQLESAGGRDYIKQTFPGTQGATDAKTFTFDWTAPPNADNGDVVFYAAGNAANGNNQPTGDNIYTSDTTFRAPTTSSRNSLTQHAKALRIGPNPVEDQLTLWAEGLKQQQLSLQILDLQGRPLLHRELKASAGEWQQTISMRALPAGVYQLRLQGKAGSYTQRVVKQ